MHSGNQDIHNPPQIILKLAESYFRLEIIPQATIIDRQPQALQQALKGMGDRHLLALNLPESLGGYSFKEIDFRRFQVMITKYSGALAFLQSQHQSAAAMLAKSSNEFLQKQYLPLMGRGEARVGVGFSHLRRRGKPIMRAIPVPGGYYLEGEVPWITGFDFFQDFIIGATTPDGQEVYGMLPFVKQENLEFSPPSALIAMSATNTVSARVSGYFLSSDRLVVVNPPQTLVREDKKKILAHSFFALGCAEAALEILDQVCYEKNSVLVRETWESLAIELKNCSDNIFEALSNEVPYQDKLALRVKAINLANRCAQAAVIASGGRSNDLDSNVGRVYREALVFSVSGQTTDTMEGSLKLLLN